MRKLPELSTSSTHRETTLGEFISARLVFCPSQSDLSPSERLVCGRTADSEGSGQNMAKLDAIPPPPFLSVFPLESLQGGGAMHPPHKRGSISAILARHPMKTRQNACNTPSAILSRQGIARYEGVSRIGPLRPFKIIHMRNEPSTFKTCSPLMVGCVLIRLSAVVLLIKKYRSS